MLPENGHGVSLDLPVNINFQWLPRHTTFSNIEYLFEMVEIMDGSDANNAFMTHQPFYSETFYNTMFVYGLDKPALLPGHKYAYRVKATATKNGEPVALFKNNGYSEVRWMEYGEACPPAINLYIDNLQPSQFDVVWEGDFNHEGYTVYYRPSGSFVDPLWEETHGTRASIRGVGPERSYLVWVGSDCGYGMTSKSKAIDVQTPSIGDYEVKGCGIPVASSPFESSAGLMQLSTNDVFLAYDFPVTVEEATGGNGTFTGTGYIRIPFLGGGQPRIKVKFKNIVINSAYRMVYGAVKTTYDSSWGSVTNLNEIFEGGAEVGNILSGNTDPEVSIQSGEIIIDYEGNPTGIEVDSASNQITITTQNENGQQTIETVNGNLHNEGDGIVTIIDTEGNLFVVDTDTGQVDHIGKLIEDATKILASFDPYIIHNDLGIVEFENDENCQWAFDRPDPAYAKSLLLFQNEYETIDHYEGESVYRPCQKLIGAGSTGKVTAKLTEGTIETKDLVFITQEGVILQPEQKGNTLNLELPAACDGDGYKLYALHKEAGSYQQVGQLKVVSYSRKMPEVVLVPVGMEREDIDLDATKNELKEIFSSVNIEIDVKVAEPFTENSWDSNGNGTIDVEGDTWFNEYTKEQLDLISAYKNYLGKNYNEDDKTAYVFVFKADAQGAEGITRKGDMPIKHQWGFVFGGIDNRTLAHELGHGIFTLRHTFDEDYGLDPQTTQNLMDYNNGTEFVKYQWDVMHDPSELGAPWQRNAEGAIVIVNNSTTNDWEKLFPKSSKKEIDKISRLCDTVAVKYADFYNRSKQKNINLEGNLKDWSVRISSHTLKRVDQAITHIATHKNPNFYNISAKEIYVGSYDMDIILSGNTYQFDTDIAMYCFEKPLKFSKPQLEDIVDIEKEESFKVGSFKLKSNDDVVMHQLPKIELVSIDTGGNVSTVILEQELPAYRIDDYLVLTFYNTIGSNPNVIFQMMPNRSNKDFEISAWLRYLDILKKDTVKVTKDNLEDIFTDTKASDERLDSVAAALTKYGFEYGINTVERMAHFIGQIGAESDGLKSLQEKSDYSARRTVEVFGLPKYGHIYNEQVFDNSTNTYSSVAISFECTKCDDGNSDGKPSEGSANFTSRYSSRTAIANAYADTLKKVNKGKPNEHDKYAERNDIVHNGPNDNMHNFDEKEIEMNYNSGRLQIKDSYLGKIALFDVVYACRIGNGTINSKDGSRYKGVGFIHLTGKANYKNVYDIWKSKHPDHKTIKNLEDFADALKTNVEIATEASMIFWNTPKNGINGNILADMNNFNEITKFINGGATDKRKREKYTNNAITELNK